MKIRVTLLLLICCTFFVTPETQAQATKTQYLFIAGMSDLHKGYHWQVFMPNGEKLFQGTFDWIYTNGWNWLFAGSKAAGCKVYNFDGKYLNIDSVRNFKIVCSEDNRVALKRNGKWGFYDSSGKRIVAHLYDNVGNFYRGRAQVVQVSDTFFVDSDGETAPFPVENQLKNYAFSDLIPNVSGRSGADMNFKIIISENKKGLADAKGNIVIPPEYEDLYLYSVNEKTKTVIAKKNDKYGVLSLSGVVIIPLTFDSVHEQGRDY